MAKLKCLDLESGLLQSNQYATPKGNTYLFHKGGFTEVKDSDDAKFFLGVRKGTAFEDVGVVKEAKKKVTKKVKEVITGKKDPEKKIYTEKELFKLTKKEQTKLIKELAGKSHAIPQYEKNRVALIMKLQSNA
jgi:hypothetical protein